MRPTLVTAASVRTGRGLAGDALLIEGDAVRALGSADQLRAPGVREVGFPGMTIIPGLRDAHFHPVTYAAAVSGVSLKTAPDFAAISDRLRDAAAGLDPGQPLVAVRLDDESLAEGRLPTRHDLDRMISDRPVLLHRYCGHIAIANTAACTAAGLSPATADPDGGSLDRDDGGTPNGVLRETAITLIAARLAGTDGTTPEQFVAAMHGLAGLGLTSLGAIVGCGDGPWATLGNELDMVLAAGPAVPIRLNVLVIASTLDQLEAAASSLENAGPRVRFLGLKAFTDGSLGGHTAAMHRPFHDRDTTGTLRLDPGWARRMVDGALRYSERIAVHAIGDRANSIALDVFEHAIAHGADPARLRIEHASVLGPDEIASFARTGVTASVQPAFLGSETEWLHKRLGPERMPYAYPFRTLWDAGVPLAGGSDCPVEPPHPLAGMALARDRAGINPSEGLPAEAAFRLFTSGAAAALAEPEPLQPGSPADFAVLDRDPVAATAAAVRGIRVVETWVGGHRVPVPDDTVVWRG